MGWLDFGAVLVVCITAIVLYLLERGFLATMRTDAAMHAGNAKDYADKASASAHSSLVERTRAEVHAGHASASADRAQNALDKERLKIEGRLASLEARLR